MVAALLDVNALIALVDSDHVSHAVMSRWFREHHHSGWATCPLTENGFIRVLSQETYPSGRRSPAEIIGALTVLKEAFQQSYQFWPDEISLTDLSAFDPAMIAGSRQITDVYLLGLAAHHKSSLVSFDRSLSWHSIRGGSQKMVRIPS